MSDHMKILVAYDGSGSAEGALDDLQRAGLPQQVEAVAISVAEQWIPVPKSYGMVDLHLTEESPSPSERAILLSKAAAKHMGTDFPQWRITSEARIGSPATEILELADEVKPDLIIVGPSGHSTLGRWVLGSVSQKVLTHSACSVRLARSDQSRDDGPIRIAIGVDGSPGSAMAVKQVAGRNWPKDVQVKLITADFGLPNFTTEEAVGPITSWIEEEREKIDFELTKSAELLKSKGMSVEQVRIPGDPKKVLCEEAEKWKADCIFVGADRMGLLDRLLLGSVSSAVATRAHCSVEVVRPKG